DEIIYSNSSLEKTAVPPLQFDEEESKEIIRFLNESIENKHLTEIEVTHFERDIYFTSANVQDKYTLAIAVYKGNEMDNFYDSDTELTDFFKIEFMCDSDEIIAFKQKIEGLLSK
ncbi:MAG: hypothetical protein ACK479_05630, partial [Fluviicola sp.]